MSRPPISYPTPQSFSQAALGTNSGARPSGLEPSPFRRESDTRTVSGPRGSTTALDSSITRLLVVTKQLLQGLEQWAQGSLSEDDVSDIYVRLGNGFELCINAFRRAGISTTDLDSVPQDLREVLERGLAEEPSQETLNVYLPEIRAIIYNLLSGLKNKQIAFKRAVSERSQNQINSSSSTSIPGSNIGSTPGSGDYYTQPVTLTRSRRESTTAGSASVLGPSGGGGSGSAAGGNSLSPETERARLGSESRSSGRLSDHESASPGSSSSLLPSTSTGSNRGGGAAHGQLPPSSALAERSANRMGSGAASTRPAPPDAFRPSRPRPSDASITSASGSRRTESPLPPVPTSASNSTFGSTSDSSSIVRHQLHDAPVPVLFPVANPSQPTPISAVASSSAAVPPRPPQRTPPHPDRRFSRDSFGNPRAQSRFSADSDITNGSPVAHSGSHSPAQNITTLTDVPESQQQSQTSDELRSGSGGATVPMLPILKLPSDISLADTVTAVTRDDDQIESQQQQQSDDYAGSRSTLAALQRSDALERRASKRFSSYTFNKMLPSSPTGKKESTSNGSPKRPVRRGEREKMPPMPPVPESLTTLVITPSDDDSNENSSGVGANRVVGNASTILIPGSPAEAAAKLSGTSPNLQPIGLGLSNERNNLMIPARARTPDQERNGDDISDQVTPRASAGTGSANGHRQMLSTSAIGAGGALSAAVGNGSIEQHQTRIQTQLNNSTQSNIPLSPPPSVKVFLQLGRQVKKATIELPTTMAALRLLFMERFEYDPGLENFPDVYVRDSRTGVQYELEDMDDLRDDCVLSLDIEPLDQVKQHFDLTFASLAQEIKELKAAFQTQSRRHSVIPSSSLLTVSPSAHKVGGSSPESAMTMARRPSTPTPSTPGVGAILGARGDPAELRAQYDQVQNLRRDLAIMRQVHVDFLNETKASFTTLRAQNSAMRDIVKTKMGGSRALLDNSKLKLEAQCQDAIQAVEEISDTIDGSREDALRRGITPSRSTMERIHSELEKATEQVESFSRNVMLADPTWRATWASELNRVMEEQRLLAYQNKLAADLKNDIKDATEMLANVQAFVDQRNSSSGNVNGSGGGGGGGSARKLFRGPSDETGSDDGNGGGGAITNLLMEIRTKESDPNSRLRAIEQQQRVRERELASRTDEFASELSGFVNGKKLKKTGGTEEAERIRQRRHDITIKRMLSDGGGLGSGSVGGGSPNTPGILTPQVTGTSAVSVTSPSTPSPVG